MRTRFCRFSIAVALVAVGLLAAKFDGPRLLRKASVSPAGPPPELALGAALVAGLPKRKRAEQRAAVFSNLGHRLSAVRTPKEAAQIILEAADALCQWDAGVVNQGTTFCFTLPETRNVQL
jgi:hypothetical protein